MTRLCTALVLAIAFLSATAGCGGGEREATTSNDTSSLVTYQYTASIKTYADMAAPFPAAVGDVITGTFTYDPSAATQKPPAGVQASIGSVSLTSTLDTVVNSLSVRNNYQITDRDGVTSNTGDHFSWVTHDTSIGERFGVDAIQVGIIMQDTTGTVFSDKTIPTELTLNRFDNAFMSIGKEVSGVGTVVFCRAQITSLNRLQ